MVRETWDSFIANVLYLRRRDGTVYHEIYNRHFGVFILVLLAAHTSILLFAFIPSFHRQSHALAVKRLRWRPRAGRAGRNNKMDGQSDSESEIEEESSWVQLASASADHSVKIFNINKQAL